MSEETPKSPIRGGKKLDNLLEVADEIKTPNLETNALQEMLEQEDQKVKKEDEIETEIKNRSEEEDDGMVQPGLPTQVQLQQNPVKNISKSDEQHTVQDCIFVIENTIGGYDDITCSPSHLKQYVQHVFNVDYDDIQQLDKSVSEQQAVAIPVLHVKLIKGENLEPKDTDGKSDPYAFLRIRKIGDRIKHEVFDSKELADHQTLVSSVMENTINPEWNEEFEFEVDEPLNSMLVVDLWDQDPETTVKSAIKGVFSMRRIGRVFAETVHHFKHDHSDDFLGFIELPIGAMPASGSIQKVQLQKRSSRSNVSGFLHLELSWHTRSIDETETSAPWHRIQRLSHLLTSIINHEARDFNDNRSKVWPGVISEQSQFLIDQFCLQQAIVPYQKSISLFESLVDYQTRQGMSHKALATALGDMLDLIEPTSGDAVELSENEEMAVIVAMRNLISAQQELLQHLFDRFEEGAAGKTSLTYICAMQKNIYSTNIWKKLNPDNNCLKDDIRKLVLKAAEAKWNEMESRSKQEVGQDEKEFKGQDVLQLVKLVDLFVGNIVFLRTTASQPFSLADGVDAYQICVRYWDDKLKDLIPECLKHYATESSMGDIQLAFQLFFRLRSLIKELEVDNFSKLNINSDALFGWFERLAIHWLQAASIAAEGWAERSVDDDDLQPVKEDVYHSSSVLILSQLLNRLLEFWERLSWKQGAIRVALIELLAQTFCNIAIYFARYTSEEVERKGFYDIEGRFDVQLPLCIALNNIMEMKNTVKNFQSDLGEECTDTINRIASSCFDTITNKFQEIMSKAMHRLKPDLAPLVAETVFVKMADTSKKGSWGHDDMLKVCGGMFDYLFANLSNMNIYLYEDAFQEALPSLWQAVLEVLIEAIAPDESFQRNVDAFSEGQAFMLTALLTELYNFFHADGKGMSPDSLTHATEFIQADRLLGLIQGSSMNLINEYLTEFGEQATATYSDQQYGKMQVFIEHLTSTKVRLREFKARNLKCMDRNGTSDPYIVIEAFGQTPVHPLKEKTCVKKKNLNPDYDEMFIFECKTKDTLVFRIRFYDKDLLSSHDFMGECYIVLKDYDKDGEINLVLNNLQPTSLALRMRRLLERKQAAGDKDAIEFLKSLNR